jgi:hypothetical protein
MNRRPARNNGTIKRVEPTMEQFNVVSPMQSVQSYKRRADSERSRVEKETVASSRRKIYQLEVL